MLQFVSPLPRNYDQIVRIFTEPVVVSTIHDVKQRSQPLFVPHGTNGACGAPHDFLDPSLCVRKTTEKTEKTEKSETPFVVKPVIAPSMDETQLSQQLGDAYMIQREHMMEQREQMLKEVAQNQDAAEHKVIEENKVEQEQTQKRQFDEQQAALRALHNTTVTVSESKAKRDVEQPLPPPDMDVKTSVSSPPVPMVRTLTVNDEKKQLANIVQEALPPPQTPQTQQPPLEKLRLDELKQLCAKRGLAVKGNKADLIARLKV